jgi:molecular chaperone GrpE
MAASDPRRKKSSGRRKKKSQDVPVSEEKETVEEKEEEKASGVREEGEDEGNQSIASEIIAERDKKIDELRNDILRIHAEFDNYRKRQAREFRRLCHTGKKELIVELLPVLDNFDRASILKDEGHPADEILTGMFQTFSMMISVLEKEGLAALDTKADDIFNPAIHEAMIAEEVSDISHDLVMEVFEKGYMLEKDLIRPTRVKVGKVEQVPSENNEQE